MAGEQQARAARLADRCEERGQRSRLGEVGRRYGERVTVLAVAVESPEEQVRELAEGLKLPAHVVMGTDERVAPFGTVTGVPTMFVFDQRG